MRIVVKIGTSLVTDESHRLNLSFLRGFVEQVSALHAARNQIVIVSSGAVAAGRGEFKVKREKRTIPFRQALAAVGQGAIMQIYREMFAHRGVAVAQALLTNYDFTNRENFLNAKNVFDLLLAAGAIPVVNENDVTTVAELKFGDNDMLSAKTAAMVGADFLCILTDVDGLFSQDPKKNPEKARLINIVQKINESVRALAGGAASKHSLGGMVTKLEAAHYAVSAGISVFIASGHRPGALSEIADFFKNREARTQAGRLPSATFFPAYGARMNSQKKWLKPKIQKNAWIEVDEGAAKALTSMGKSLLSSGITKVSGGFKRGDVVVVRSGGREIGYGQINYASEDLDKIKRHKSGEIERILGFSFEEEAMHRDRMVITG